MISNKRVGLFGGSFNPPHNGHLNIAKCFLDNIVDELIIMPTAVPPHKKIDGNVTSEDRLEMCKRAFSPLESHVYISDYEIKKGGISYTSDTLGYLHTMYDDIYMLCGTDMFLSLDMWHLPEKVFELSTIVCALRDSDARLKANVMFKAEYYKEIYGAKILLPEFSIVEVSSTEVRNAISSNGDVSSFISNSVEEYIKFKGLYK